jgi:hypothetical protein
MRRLTLTMAPLAISLCLAPGHAVALPFTTPAGTPVGIEAIDPLDKVICRPPPWYAAGRGPSHSCAPIFGGGRAFTIVGWGCTIVTIATITESTTKPEDGGMFSLPSAGSSQTLLWLPPHIVWNPTLSASAGAGATIAMKQPAGIGQIVSDGDTRPGRKAIGGLHARRR